VDAPTVLTGSSRYRHAVHDGGLARAAVAAGLLVVALTLLVVATSDPPTGFAEIGDAGWIADVMVGVVAVGAVVGVVAVPALIVLTARGPEAGAKRRPATRSWFVRLVGPLVPISILVLIVTVLHQSGTPVPMAETFFGKAQKGLSGKGVDNEGARQTNWAVVGLTVGGMALLAAAGTMAIRRRQQDHVEESMREAPPDPVSLAEAAQASLDALDDQPDHRLAVIAAYARMEQLFGEAGLPRWPAETAREHVDRALGQLGAPPEVVAVLAQLFEEARFSTREIGPDARADAVRALTRLRDEMASVEQPDVDVVGVQDAP
jgi:hypothetical protein